MHITNTNLLDFTIIAGCLAGFYLMLGLNSLLSWIFLFGLLAIVIRAIGLLLNFIYFLLHLRRRQA